MEYWEITIFDVQQHLMFIVTYNSLNILLTLSSIEIDEAFRYSHSISILYFLSFLLACENLAVNLIQV